MLDAPSPPAFVQTIQEDVCRGGEPCAVPAGNNDAEVTDGQVRRTEETSLPEGGPSALTSDQLSARSTSREDFTSFYDRNGLNVRWYFQGGLNLVSETNLFWNFASVYAPDADFNSDETWLEGYVKPGIGFEKAFAGANVLYGKLSGVGSRTWGTDAFDARNQGAVTLEEGYLGFRTAGAPINFDLSLGPRELRLGTGMLIANGGVSGFERGALKFGPRKAWKKAAIARIMSGRQTFTGYFIAPNELPSNNG